MVAAGFEGEHMRDFVAVYVVVHFGEKAARQLVQLHGLVHVVPAAGQVTALSQDVGQLHFVGEQAERVEIHVGLVGKEHKKTPAYSTGVLQAS